jgi:1-deoxy-D-xylulose-5-phosphate synthase
LPVGSEAALDLLLPDSLRALEPPELAELARVVRHHIIRTVKARGGHYSSPLGVVELAVALHYVFESPTDRLIWDTGHQAYAHKLLTGRWSAFARLRGPNGASGFPRIGESIHDTFGTGHTSTAIAAALGLSLSVGVQGWVVPIIGDGALAGGPALEALTMLAGHVSKVCVVLNDNGFAISKAVGALVDRPGDSYRHLAAAMGLPYIGPIGGHCLPELISCFQDVKLSGDLAFVHVRTTKGSGDAEAESDPITFYSITTPGPRSASNERSTEPGEQRSMQAVFADEVSRLARLHPDLKVITPAMSIGAGLQQFGATHPDRLLDVGIAEATAVTAGSALAAAGDRAIVHVYSTFLQRAVDQLIHDVGLQALPLIVAVDRVGLSGEDGPTHHGVFDLSFLGAVPNLTVFSVSCADLLRSALSWAMGHDGGPVAIRFSKGKGVEWGRDGAPGMDVTAKCILRQEGADATVLVHGRISGPTRNAVLALEATGISCRLVEVVRLRPLQPGELGEFVLSGRPIVVVEESISTGSLGATVLAMRNEVPSWGTVKHVCINLPCCTQGPWSYQLRENGLDERSIAGAVRRAVAGL